MKRLYRVAGSVGGSVTRVVALRLEQVLRVLDLTDSFNTRRGAVIVSLVTDEKGRGTLLSDGQ
jgi:hypothetical protein